MWGAVHPFDDIEELPAAWTAEHVGCRLAEACQWVERLGIVGPSAMSNGWPEYRREFFDRIGEAPSSIRSTPRIVSGMEDALEWPHRYIRAPGLRRVLWAWALASRKGQFRLVCRQRGWNVHGAHNRRRHALALIAAGLNVDGRKVF